MSAPKDIEGLTYFFISEQLEGQDVEFEIISVCNQCGDSPFSKECNGCSFNNWISKDVAKLTTKISLLKKIYTNSL